MQMFFKHTKKTTNRPYAVISCTEKNLKAVFFSKNVESVKYFFLFPLIYFALIVGLSADLSTSVDSVQK